MIQHRRRNSETDSGVEENAARRLPASIWALGFVSLFMDISSEMIHALLPVFLVTVLGASTVTVGIIEGIGEAAASIAKLFSGWLSDRLGKRKLLTVLGYGIGALSKPLFALAPAASWVLIARFSDRIGKGIRGAPRDALVSELAPPRLWGAAYGLRQSLDTVGAFAGPLLAIALMALSSDNFRLVFWLAVVPGLIAVGILVIGVREPARHVPERAARTPIRWQELGVLGGHFWGVVGVGTVLTLARFSEAFLILRAEEQGLPLTLVPAVLIVMNVVYAVSAYPMGALSDKADKRVILTGGFTVLIIADIILALAPNFWVVILGAGLWGLHMGMTQGLLATLVAETAPAALRGSAFGLFHLVTGMALLAASLIAGVLWEWVGPSATFIAGAAFTAVGLAGAITLLGRRRERAGR
ncbi:MAG: MFS transporter [Granulosicoccaceae bacterium]|jgi:MFS family permease